MHTSHVLPVIRCHSRYLVSQPPLSLPSPFSPRRRTERTLFIGKDLPKAISLCEHLKSRGVWVFDIEWSGGGGFLGHFLLFYFSSRFYGAIETISSGLEYEKDGNEAFNGSSRFNYRNEWTITSISNFRWKFVILYEVFTDLYRTFLPRNWNFDLYLFSILPEKWDCVERILRMIMFTQSHVDDISWKKLSIEYF